ncbi:MAG: PTS sugar transporter subunit IIA [Spirochaetales bacterium]|nr:PTS sugar transporter subunit IIA [Spirochaetales bacterium]
MALIDIIQENIIKTPLVSKSKLEVIRELIQILKDAGKIANTENVYDAVYKRETLGSTGLANGIAVPHAKTSEVDTLTMAIGVAPEGIDYEALDGQPSRLFFLLLAAPSQSGPHIEALAEIASITKSEAFCRMVIQAKSAREILNIIKMD